MGVACHMTMLGYALAVVWVPEVVARLVRIVHLIPVRHHDALHELLVAFGVTQGGSVSCASTQTDPLPLGFDEALRTPPTGFPSSPQCSVSVFYSDSSDIEPCSSLHQVHCMHQILLTC